MPHVLPALAFALCPLALSACLPAQADPDELTEDPGTNEEGLTGSIPAGTVLRTLASLNLRAQPSTSSAVLDVMPPGTKVTVESPTPENGFYRIAHEGTLGWASGQYLEPESGGVQGPADAATLTATADVNLRSGPSTADSILAVVPTGTVVSVVQPDPVNGFYNITYNKLTGWTSGKYLVAAGDAPPANPSTPSASTPVAGGHVWKFKAKTLAVDIAVFVPAAAEKAPEVDVLVYSHGLNVCSPVAKSPPISFATEAPFKLAQIVADSGRPIVLVVPFMDWEHLYANGMSSGGSNHKLGVPTYLNGVVDEVLAEVGQQQNTDAPALASLVLAGHSRAYSFLNPLAAAHADPQMSKGALARLTHVWGLDSSYSCHVPSWTAWLASKPELRAAMFYKSGTGTATCGQQFANASASTGGRLTSKTVPEAHCAVPSAQLPALLQSLP